MEGANPNPDPNPNPNPKLTKQTRYGSVAWVFPILFIAGKITRFLRYVQFGINKILKYKDRSDINQSE